VIAVGKTAIVYPKGWRPGKAGGECRSSPSVPGLVGTLSIIYVGGGYIREDVGSVQSLMVDVIAWPFPIWEKMHVLTQLGIEFRSPACLRNISRFGF
jgi:hypothetical protein